jgi:hypothetical protein
MVVPDLTKFHEVVKDVTGLKVSNLRRREARGERREERGGGEKTG